MNEATFHNNVYALLQLQELKGNIRVFVRCRHDDMVECCVDFPTEKEVQAPNGKRLKFDRVFPPETTQDEVCGTKF